MSYTIENVLKQSMGNKAADEFQSGVLEIYNSTPTLLASFDLPASLSSTSSGVVDLTAGGTLSTTVESGIDGEDPDHFIIKAGGDGDVGSGTAVLTGAASSAGSGGDVSFNVNTNWNDGDSVQISTANYTVN
jgi:hypothetical protein